MSGSTDLDTSETNEWLDSLRAVLHHQGPARAAYLLARLTDEAYRVGVPVPSVSNTPYINTIPPEREARADWDRDIEHRIRSVIRWNAVAIILRANKESSELGGHHRKLPVGCERFTISALDISGMRRLTRMAAISFTCRATRRPVFMPRIYRRQADRGAIAGLQTRSKGQRPLVLSPSVVDAGILAIPYGVHGALGR